MAPAILGADVTGVKVALILDSQLDRVKGVCE
jgi:hypothetical protein